MSINGNICVNYFICFPINAQNVFAGEADFYKPSKINMRTGWVTNSCY